MTRPGILIIENAVDITGGLTSVLRSSRALRDDFDFTFVLPSGSKARQIVTAAGFAVYELPFVEIRKNIGSALSYVPSLLLNAMRLRSLIRRVRPSLMVANDFYNLVPATYHMLGGKVPYVCFIRFVPSRFPGALVKLWMSANLKHAEKVIAVSETVLKDCPTSTKITQVYDPLPANDDQYQSAVNSTTILCLANFIRGKGQQFVLESFARLSKEFPSWKIRFVGSDMGLQKNREFREELQEKAKELSILDQTEWLPATELPEKEYLASAFTVNFSESESFSLTCLESLFAGRAVVATRSGGPAEIIDHERSGFLVPVGAVDEMTNAMRILMSDFARRESMSNAAYHLVRQRFSSSNTIGRLSAVYFTALETNKRRK